ncbi:GTP-binding protein [Patescibacteria group bacterium]|nr:GTP-binding protein [Patescibacteria group bacterium]
MQTTQTRPPIVTVLGHVDHGKTTLLDAIRKSNVASKEAGGITQSIGASTVTTKEGKTITFIDTPGHAAFSKMRSRGAKVADLALLVVAADDGVKPQTIEALQLIKAANIPFIVVASKVDLPSASVETLYGQLEKEQVLFENRGGATPLVQVSAKNGTGIEEILEMISLVADLEEIKADPKAILEAVVIETTKNTRGLLTSAVVRNGTLKVGQEVYCEGLRAKVRGLFDDKGQSVKEIICGFPAQILGFEKLPSVGAVISGSEASMALQVEGKKELQIKVEEGQLPVIVKAKNAGSLEAIIAGLPKDVVVLDSGVGDVFESDVLLARSSGAKYILAFESKAPTSVMKLAEAEGVKIEAFQIIYELFQKVEEILKGGQIEILGKAEIVASFPFNNKKVAGCRVTLGRINKTDTLIVQRGEKELGRVKIVSLKKQKQDIAEAKIGEEFGVIFAPQLDFAEGDVIVSVRK